ncbi:bcl-2-like protein 1 [Portunus trituberculatus]|uniref:bcl-2-like protein 1 n=1 Tax=Portunus trituberculatus TaxID=210409 RepID=UPI001E1CE90C|nr:bcl-2-like protein 1 [Portunus trituberculatus]
MPTNGKASETTSQPDESREGGVLQGELAARLPPPPYNSLTATHSWKRTNMSPEVNKEPVASKVPSDNETDEGFHSPSTSRSELRCSKEEEGTTNRAESQNSTKKTQEKPDNDVIRARRLAEFTVLTVTGRSKSPPQDSVEETLIRCVRNMMQKHEILLRGMMRRLDVRPETGYQAFVGVANELFEGQKRAVTWGRVVALYAFGAQLALHCTEKKEEEFCTRIVEFLGQYASEVLVPFVKQEGGWSKICEEFPAEVDLESKAWKVLTWTAIGLGLAATASFFTSH